MSAVVTVENLSKHYGRHRVVDDVSFAIERGEVLGLLGPNGSGKTTILRILTGYLHATGGRVQVAGFDVVEQGIQARRRIGYVPEDAPLYTHMRVDESLNFMGRLKGLAGEALATAVDAACARLSLDPVRARSVGKLSRGYRQRVAIAQALLNEPDLLVLDEPTNGLDPRQIIELRQLIRELSRHHTILITSHILAEMERVATRVAILLDGRLLALHALDGAGSQRMRVQARGTDPRALAALLGSITGVLEVQDLLVPREGVAQATVALASAECAGNVAPALVAAGVVLVGLSEVSPELEPLFLSLTEGRRP